MSKNQTISLPDELHDRLQAVKEKIPVSYVCQVAIETAVRMEELKMSASDQMQEAKIKYRAQKQESMDRIYNEGKEDGIQCAKEMDFDELDQVDQIQAVIQEKDYSAIDSLQETDLWNTWFAERDNDDFSRYGEEKQEKFARGWLDGVEEYHEQLKD